MVCVFVFIVVFNFVQSLGSSNKFVKIFGSESRDDQIHEVVYCSDGGFGVVGYSRDTTNGFRNVLVGKFGENGELIWLKVWGGDEDDTGYVVEETGDGGLIITGYTKNLGILNILYAMFDIFGNIVMKQSLGGALDDIGRDIKKTIDGGYILNAQSYNVGSLKSLVLVKLNSTGGIVWMKGYDSADDDGTHGVLQTSDGGYAVLVDHLTGGNSHDHVLVKLDSSGNFTWGRRMGDTSYDDIGSFVETDEGGFLGIGHSNHFGTYGFFITKIDPPGYNDSFVRVIKCAAQNSYATEITKVSDGGYILVGQTYCHGGGDSDILLIKLNSTGYVEFAKTYGSSDYEMGYSIKEVLGEGFVVGGYCIRNTVEDAVLIKMNYTGDICFKEGGNLEVSEWSDYDLFEWDIQYTDFSFQTIYDDPPLTFDQASRDAFVEKNSDFYFNDVDECLVCVGSRYGETCEAESPGMVSFSSSDPYVLNFKDAVETSMDYGSVVVGMIQNGSSYGHVIGKFASSGVPEWWVCYMNESVVCDVESVVEIPGIGDIVSVGTCDDRLYIFKHDSDGNMIYQKRMTGSSWSSGHDAVFYGQDNDNMYVLGARYDNPPGSYLILNISVSDGSLNWAREFQSETGMDLRFGNISELLTFLPDDGFLLSGTIEAVSLEPYVLLVHDNGSSVVNVTMSFRLDSNLSFSEGKMGMVIPSSFEEGEGYVGVGYIFSSGLWKSFMIKFDETGAISRGRLFSSGGYAFYSTMIVDVEDGYLVGGTVYDHSVNHYLLLRVDYNLDLISAFFLGHNSTDAINGGLKSLVRRSSDLMNPNRGNYLAAGHYYEGFSGALFVELGVDGLTCGMTEFTSQVDTVEFSPVFVDVLILVSQPNLDFEDYPMQDFTSSVQITPYGLCNDLCQSEIECENGDCWNNDCVCRGNWYGDICDVTTCSGFYSNDTSNVCSGRGDCVDYETCECYVEYNGSTCLDRYLDQDKYFSLFFNISSGGEDKILSVRQGREGGQLFVGRTEEGGNIVVGKFSYNGTLEWVRVYENSGQIFPNNHIIELEESGDIVIVGGADNSDWDGFIFRVDGETGKNILWANTYPLDISFFESVVQEPGSGDLLVVGQGKAFGVADGIVAKFRKEDGLLLWERCWGGTEPEILHSGERVYQETLLLAVGYTMSLTGSYKTPMIALINTTDGDVVYHTAVIGQLSETHESAAGAVMKPQDYSVVFFTDLDDANECLVCKIKVFSPDSILWCKYITSWDGQEFHCQGIEILEESDDQDYLLIGTVVSPSDPFPRSVLLRLSNETGDLLWVNAFNRSVELSSLKRDDYTQRSLSIGGSLEGMYFLLGRVNQNGECCGLERITNGSFVQVIDAPNVTLSSIPDFQERSCSLSVVETPSMNVVSPIVSSIVRICDGDIMCGDIAASEVEDVCGGFGTCFGPGYCDCETNWFGDDEICNITICNGYLSNETESCEHGTCLAPEYCECESEWLGEGICNITMCNGYFSNETISCGEHGSCEAPQFCKCESNWFGEDICNTTHCNGYFSNETSSCGDHGTCVSPEICDCDPNWYGEDICNITHCNGFYSNETASCGVRGTCIGPEYCDCDTNWYGEDVCNITQCNGYFSNETRSCGDHGFCIGYENCDCDSNYFGLEICNITKCNGVLSNESAICNYGNGTCVEYNVCNCSGGYYGENCELYKCNNLIFNDSSICFSHGTCYAPEKCSCDANYYLSSDYCEWYNCSGIRWDEQSVCNFGNGSCDSFDNCSCSEGYAGGECEEFLCDGLPPSLTDYVCHGNGICGKHDFCQCFEGWTGEFCDVPVCQGLPSSNNQSCSGHGRCETPNDCDCDDDWDGDECENPKCFGFPSSNPLVCSSHGTCSSFDECQCMNGELYFGIECFELVGNSTMYENEEYVVDIEYSTLIYHSTVLGKISEDGFVSNCSFLILNLGQFVSIPESIICKFTINSELNVTEILTVDFSDAVDQERRVAYEGWEGLFFEIKPFSGKVGEIVRSFIHYYDDDIDYNDDDDDDMDDSLDDDSDSGSSVSSLFFGTVGGLVFLIIFTIFLSLFCILSLCACLLCVFGLFGITIVVSLFILVGSYSYNEKKSKKTTRNRGLSGGLTSLGLTDILSIPASNTEKKKKKKKKKKKAGNLLPYSFLGSSEEVYEKVTKKMQSFNKNNPEFFLSKKVWKRKDIEKMYFKDMLNMECTYAIPSEKHPGRLRKVGVIDIVRIGLSRFENLELLPSQTPSSSTRKEHEEETEGEEVSVPENEIAHSFSWITENKVDREYFHFFGRLTPETGLPTGFGIKLVQLGNQDEKEDYDGEADNDDDEDEDDHKIDNEKEFVVGYIGEFKDGLEDGKGKSFKRFKNPRNAKRLPDYTEEFMQSWGKNYFVQHEGSFKRGLVHGNCRVYNQEERRYMPVMEFDGEYLEGKRSGWGQLLYSPENRKTCYYRRVRYERGKIVDEFSSSQIPILEGRSFVIVCDAVGKSELIGKGGYGSVFKVKTASLPYVEEITKEKYVAVKLMDCSKCNMSPDELFRKSIRGFQLCYRVKNKAHIVEEFCLLRRGKEVGVVMELCDETMADRVKVSDELSLVEKINYIYQTVIAIRELHRVDVMHRDLKWGNVLIKKSVLKLCDFDTIREDESYKDLEEENILTSVVGTTTYKAPEITKGTSSYGVQSDVYSIGVMIYGLFAGLNNPFSTVRECSCGVFVNSKNVDFHIAEHELRPSMKIVVDRNTPKGIIDLIQKCWENDPSDRPNTDRIILNLEEFARKTLKMDLEKMYEEKISRLGENLEEEEEEEDVYQDSTSSSGSEDESTGSDEESVGSDLSDD